jgi:hypothetical protein
MSSSATPPGSSTIDSSNLRSIDRRITSLRVRIRTMSPRSAALVPAYRDEIDRLLDLRLWLMRDVLRDRPRLHAV